MEDGFSERKGEWESGRIWTWNKVKARSECGNKGGEWKGERKKEEEYLRENRGWERPERELGLPSDARSASTGGYMEMLVKYIIPAWQCNSLICLAPPAATPKPCIQTPGADGNGVDRRPKRPIEDLQTRFCYCYRLFPFHRHLSLHFRSLCFCFIQTAGPTGWGTALQNREKYRERKYANSSTDTRIVSVLKRGSETALENVNLGCNIHFPPILMLKNYWNMENVIINLKVFYRLKICNDIINLAECKL